MTRSETPTIRDEFTLKFTGAEHYDQDGSLVRIVEHVWGMDRLYHRDTGSAPRVVV